MVSKTMTQPHPLQPLSLQETDLVRDVILQYHADGVIDFRVITLQEPAKADLIPFLEAEHGGKLTFDTPRPPRLAKAHYDLIDGSKIPQYIESIIDIDSAKLVNHQVISTSVHACLTVHEFQTFVKVCKESKLFQQKLAEHKLPSGFDVVIEPWPYGGVVEGEENRRYFQGLIFAVDTRSGNPDSNFYAFPLPLIPIMDWVKREIIRVEILATGGKGDSFTAKTHAEGVLDHCKPAEYVPELLDMPLRKDLKELSVVQPEGPSFSVADDSLVEWQKWRFRVSFNPREGAVLHDIHYDGRSVLYRLSISEMSVPYADPREPFHRKQAFDFGDGGIGHCVNNLQLGCDCLGVIKYFDGVVTDADGKAQVAPNVICLHEQDNGINWKHTNWRTGRAVVSRRRELVVQFIITLANYEYVFNYIFDQAGAIHVQTRATGIVSVINIDADKTCNWGNVVNPGVLAQNHQHIFCVRIDPAIDGHKNTVVVQESLPVPMNDESNPRGNYYQVKETPVSHSTGLDNCWEKNRAFKIQNLDKKNPISGKPVGYKVVTPATQKLLADPESVQAKRALFTNHHLWVTKYKDDELYAGGRYTLQSTREREGLADAAARNDDVLQSDVVVWSVFGLTHNPRVEDWPVMPVEIREVAILPNDFFTCNPAIDVPSVKNQASKLVNGTNGHTTNGASCCQE